MTTKKEKRKSKLLANEPRKKELLKFVATKNEEATKSEDSLPENYNKILDAIKKGYFLIGTLKSVTRKVNADDGKSELVFKVDVLGFECIVNENQWWMFDTKILYRPEISNLTLEQASYTRALKMINARVPIIPFKIKEITEDSDKLTNKKIKKYLLFGSRTYAMAKLQDIWFFHKYHNDEFSVKVGDNVSTRVLFTNRNNICVECFGVEVYVNILDVSSRFVADCRDLYKPGQDMKVTVRGINIEDKKVKLSLSARMYETKLNYTSSKINEIKKKSAYFGVVTHISNTGHYIVSLSNGVIGDVSPNCVQSCGIVSPGDNVVFVCTGIAKDKNLAFGVITK